MKSAVKILRSIIETETLQDHIEALRRRVNGRDAFIEGLRPSSFQTALQRVSEAANAFRAGFVAQDKAVALITRDPLTIATIAFAAMCSNRSVLIVNPDLPPDARWQHLQYAKAGLVIADSDMYSADQPEDSSWKVLSADRSRFPGSASAATTALRTFARKAEVPADRPLAIEIDSETLRFAVDESRQVGFSIRNVRATVSVIAETFAIDSESCVGIEPGVFDIHGFLAGPMAGFLLGSRHFPQAGATVENVPSYLGAVDRWQVSQLFMRDQSLAHCLDAPKIFDDSFDTDDMARIAVVSETLAETDCVAAFERKFGRRLECAIELPALGGITFLNRNLEDSEVTLLGEPLGCELFVDSSDRQSEIQAGKLYVGGQRLGNSLQLKCGDNASVVVDGKILTDFVGFLTKSGDVQLADEDALAGQEEAQGGVGEIVYEAAGEVFKLDVSYLGPDSDGENTPGWTSLTSVELILMLEERLSVTFKPREIMNMITLGDVIAVCEKKNAEKG